MEKTEFLQMIKDIGVCEDDVERRSKLAELEDGISNIFDSNVTLTEQNTKLSTDNESLRSANMKLFLRVGSESPENRLKNETGNEGTKEPRKFDNLFNEKGEIK